MLQRTILTTLVAVLTYSITTSPARAANWPQAAGPNANWTIKGKAPAKWSVVRGENIVWRTELPEGGQSSVTIWGDKAFLTCHKPLQSADETKTSTDIDGYCLDANTGRILWNVRLPGSVAVGTAGIFSDATVFAPVTDGQHVWFFNRSGSIGCYNFEGDQVWLREFVPRNRHTNRQCEPILFGGQIITLEVRNKDAGEKLKRHAPVPGDIDPQSVWTCLHGIDKHTGKVLWTESAGTVCHNTPMLGYTADGRPGIIHARGGGHGPLEKPYGMSLTSLAKGQEGKTIWSVEMPKLDPPFNNHWNEKHVYVFHGRDHVVLNTQNGKELSRVGLNDNVNLWKHVGTGWELESETSVRAGRSHANTNQANIVVGNWHYFLAHDIHAIGRVNVMSGKVEYLEVPIQVAAKPDGNDVWIWEKNNTIPITTNNSRGINIANDKRASRTGWGHVSAASPTLVGRYLYFPVMTGTIYVIDTQAKTLNGEALVAVNDLGTAGQVWTLTSFSSSDTALFTRTMTEVIRIQSTD